MKKLIAIAVVLALVAGAAFADTANGISVQAWGRGAFSPLVNYGPQQDGSGNVSKGPDGKDDKGETYTGSGYSWGAGQKWPNPDGRIRVDFRINGDSDYAGFQTQFLAEDGIGVGDNCHIWVKPFSNDILKLIVGKINDDTLRGKIGDLNDGFESFVMGDPPDEDAIFTRFGNAPGSTNHTGDWGYMISSAPIDGLFIGLIVNGSIQGGDYNKNDRWDQWKFTPAKQAYQYMQIGVGYNIANIGHIRAQYVGGWAGVQDPDSDDYQYYEDGKRARIEAAFALTAVEGLLVDLGLKIGLEDALKDSSRKSDGLGVGLGAKFNSGAFGIGARFDISGLGAYANVNDGAGRAWDNDKSEDSATTVIRLVPTFGFGDATTIGLDFALKLGGKSKDKDGKDIDNDWSQIGFGAYIRQGLGSGNIKAGLSYTLAPTNHDGKPYGSSIFQIPIILEYAFF